MDIIIALLVLPLLVLIGLFIGLAIYIEDKGNIFYKAKRRGMNGESFEMFKFRSMNMDAPDLRNEDNSTFNSEEDPRVTKIGRIIRKISIDELPQIINIIKGDMSWIGPRPPIPREGYDWDDLGNLQKKRLTVRPGITGYTAALFRNSVSKQERLEHDCFYVDHVSFLLDIKIIFWTIKTVVLRKNIYRN